MKIDTPLIEKIIRKIENKAVEYQTPIVDLIEAQTKEPWKVLVATILSARTSDAITTRVTTKLFKKIKYLNDFNKFSLQEIEKLIFPIGFYRNKAKFLHALPQAVQDQFNGKIPDTIDDLVTLPGVGRKTANLVVSIGFHKPAICVDTHVHRIMNIWGYVNTKTPFETEMALRKKLPKKYWIRINSLLVSHGQSTCRPISPHCDICVVNQECPKINVKPRKALDLKTKKIDPKTLLLISWNVNGIRAVEQKGFTSIIESLNPDIVTVQETKAHPNQLSEELLHITGYTSYWSSAKRKGYSGVGIYTKIEPINVIEGLGIEQFDLEGRVLTLEYKSFYLLNCYFPNSQHELKRLDFKIEFDQAIQDFCLGLNKKKTVVICGDFNVAHKAIDLKNPKSNENNPGYTIQERTAMDRFIASGFIDTFRMFNQEPDNYTWWSYRFNARQKNIGWRIDYFCIDKKSKSRVVAADILPDIMGSDHCPISLQLRCER